MSDDHDHDDLEPERHAILSRRALLIAGAVSGVAGAASAQPQVCLSPAPPPEAHFSRGPGRILTPLERVPEPIRARLRHNSIYAAGGGLTSIPWRVVLLLEGPVALGRGDRRGGASFETLASEWTTRVDGGRLHMLVALADRAWREPRPPNRNPTADYDEVLAMRDGDDVFFAQGFGPLRGGAAGELVSRLRQLLDRPR